MTDNQTLANSVGATLRAAEQEAANESATATAVHLATLHDQLGQVYLAFNELAAQAGVDPLNWAPIAGGTTAARAPGGGVANSGGGNKGEPTKP